SDDGKGSGELPRPCNPRARPASWQIGQRALANQATRLTCPSRQDALDHVAMHVGEAEVAPAVAERQLLVVDAHQVQDRRVQVMDVDAVLYGVDAQLVGGAVGQAALDAAAG